MSDASPTRLPGAGSRRQGACTRTTLQVCQLAAGGGAREGAVHASGAAPHGAIPCCDGGGNASVPLQQRAHQLEHRVPGAVVDVLRYKLARLRRQAPHLIRY